MTTTPQRMKKKGEPALASAGTQLNDLPGLVVCVTGWAQVDGHVECKIATELWRRLGDADKLLAPRVRQMKRVVIVRHARAVELCLERDLQQPSYRARGEFGEEQHLCAAPPRPLHCRPDGAPTAAVDAL